MAEFRIPDAARPPPFVFSFARMVPRLAVWGLPLAVGGILLNHLLFRADRCIIGAWFVYPALTPSFKKSIGLA